MSSSSAARRSLHWLRLSIALCAVAAWRAPAQTSVTLVVESNANLRDGPSTSHSVIRTLQAGETVTLLSAHTSHDYLHVVSATDTGWVYSPLVELATTPVAVVPTPPGAVTSAPSAYHGCALEGNPSANGPNVVALRALNEHKNRFFVVNVKVGGIETVNCKATVSENR